jgi:hypothetical protein
MDKIVLCQSTIEMLAEPLFQAGYPDHLFRVTPHPVRNHAVNGVRRLFSTFAPIELTKKTRFSFFRY